MQKKKRNRSRPVESFEIRLEKYAYNTRAKACRMPPGKERDALMKKAVQVDNVLAVNEWLHREATRAFVEKRPPVFQGR